MSEVRSCARGQPSILTCNASTDAQAAIRRVSRQNNGGAMLRTVFFLKRASAHLSAGLLAVAVLSGCGSPAPRESDAQSGDGIASSESQTGIILYFNANVLTLNDVKPAANAIAVGDGRILAVDEYWATAEAPPAWRDALPGRARFDAMDDPRARTP